MLNCDYYIGILETIQLYAKGSTGLFKDVSKKYVYKSYKYSMYMYKEDLALNNLQWLICYKTKPNQIIYI